MLSGILEKDIKLQHSNGILQEMGHGTGKSLLTYLSVKMFALRAMKTF